MTKAKRELAGMKYVGDAWIPGVPARDLNAEEAARYVDRIRESERASHKTLYEPIFAPDESAAPSGKEGE